MPKRIIDAAISTMNLRTKAAFTLATILLSTHPSQAIVLAFDDFESYSAGELVGQNGGTGWNGEWQGSTAASEIVAAPTNLSVEIGGGATISGGNYALRIDQNNNSAVSREFATAYSGDFYFSFLIYAEASSSLSDNDFVSIWLGEALFQGAPSMGLKAGEGPNGEDLMGRISGTQEVYGGELVNETAYYLVGKVSKQNGSTTFNQLDFWLNPSANEALNPQATSTGSINFSDFSQMGIRSVNLDAGDSLLIDSYTLATEWEDVVPVPELSRFSLFLGLNALACVFLKRKRSEK